MQLDLTVNLGFGSAARRLPRLDEVSDVVDQIVENWEERFRLRYLHFGDVWQVPKLVLAVLSADA